MAAMIPVQAVSADSVSNLKDKVNQSSAQVQQEKAQAAAIAAQLHVDNARLDQLAQQYEVAQQRVTQLDSQLAATRAEIVQEQQRVAAAMAQLRADALQTYMSGTSSSEAFESLFVSGGEQSMVTQEYRRVVTNNIAGAIDQLHVAQLALANQQNQLQATETQARAATTLAGQARQQAAQVQAQQQAALAGANAKVTAFVQQQQADQAALQQAQYQAELAAEQQTGLSTNVPVSQDASGAVAAAESQLGVPYRWGGESPKGSAFPGFDCSGLTQWSWSQAGLGLPRTAQQQYDAIAHIPLSSLQPGDLLFWNDGTSSVQHVGMYVGNGNVIDAPQTGENVQIQPIWGNGLVGAGRP